MKVPDIKFHGNPSSGSHTVICGQTDRQASITKFVGTLATMRMYLTLAVLSLDNLPATLTAYSPLRQFNASAGLRKSFPASRDEIFAILGFYAA
jgi:hypothetical protein